MGILGNPVDLAKRIVELEVHCDQLEYEKVKLREQVMDVRCKEEKMKGKCMNLKRKYGEMMDRFVLEERKWKDENGEIREKSRLVEVQKRKLEIDLKAEMAMGKRTGSDETVGKLERYESLELKQKIQVLEREKEQIIAEVVEESTKLISGLICRIESLDKEKSDMEAETFQENMEKSATLRTTSSEKMVLEDVSKKAVSMPNNRIEALEKEKREMESKYKDILRSLNQKIVAEAEKRALEEKESKKTIVELNNRVEALEKAKMEMNEETERILKEKVDAVAEKKAFEESSKKKVGELLERNEALLEEKREIEAKYSEKNAEIERILKEKMDQDACNRNRRLSRIIDIDDASSVGDVQDVSVNLASCRRRSPKIWNVDRELLDAFDDNPELSLEAICALYRQHKSSLCSKPTNTCLPLGARGLKPDCSTKVIALAEYLINDDPKDKMTKSVAELEQLHSVAVDQCIKIAKQHYKQVFEIYKSKDDPYFSFDSATNMPCCLNTNVKNHS